MAIAESLADYKRGDSSKIESLEDSHAMGGGDEVPKDHNAPKKGSGKTFNVREGRDKAERKEFTPKIKCFLCDGPHWARDCPKRKALSAMIEEREQEDEAHMGSMQLLGALQFNPKPSTPETSSLAGVQVKEEKWERAEVACTHMEEVTKGKVNSMGKRKQHSKHWKRTDPSDIRKQSGIFGDALAHHERDADEKKKEMIQKWRTALTEAASLSGWHVDDQFETEVVNEIINTIVGSLKRQPLNVSENIVGISVHLEKLKLMMNTELNKVSVIGICGPGGIGKTTIAEAIYNKISYQYDSSSFLRNIREKSQGDTLQLQNELLHDILKEKGFKISNIDEGVTMIKRCLNSKRVLVILDDVDDLKQLKHLAEKKDWFNAKSTIIITSRDKQVLARYGVDTPYEVQKFDKKEAIELFSLWAFQENLPKEAYENLSYNMIEYADGLPLALKLLGASLFGKKISEWESALYKLKRIPHMEINKVLRISFDGLDDMDKEIFLDVACFFKGKSKDFVSRILGPHAEYGIATLNDKCLITISKNMMDMHDLIQQMGKEIIRQECPDDLGRRSRIWDSDAYDVLTRNMGTRSIKGLFLDICKFPTQFTKESFKQMDRLRLLKIHKDDEYGCISRFSRHLDGKLFSEDHLPRDFEFPSYELTYFHWDGYSLESLPTNFHAKDLVELILRGSNIKQLWRGNKLHNKLNVINLSHSVHLTEIPDFSSVPNLEILTLKGCVKLECLPRGIYKWKHLQTLSCGDCSKLKRFPEIKGNMRKLRELDLSGTAIEELPSSSSFGHLKALKILSFRGCSKLNKIPTDVCCLSSLEVLDLSYCNIMEGGIPSDICRLSSLIELNLKSNDFRSIPATINRLSRLQVLNLSHCQNLEHIPELPSSLRLLDAHGPNQSLSTASFLPFHSLVNCFNSEIQDLNQCSQNCNDSAYHGNGICIVLPGHSGVPEWMMERRTIELPQNWHQDNEFLGFAICCVYVPLDDESEDISENESDHKSQDESAAELFSEDVYLPSCCLKCALRFYGDNDRSTDFHKFESHCLCYGQVLMGNQFSSIPDGISQLHKLIVLNLSHCKLLQHIPEPPSNLRTLVAHQCTSLKISSSLLWSPFFKSGIQKFVPRGKVLDTFIPESNGIPEWISHQKKGSKITLTLPQNWYENDDFLGFALCSLHVPLDIEWRDIDESRNFICKLNFNNNPSLVVRDIQSRRHCQSCRDGDESNQLWLIKIAKSMIPNIYHSNKYRTLNASFKNDFDTKSVKVERCGFQLLYAQDYGHNHLTIVQGSSSSHGDLGGHRSAVQDTNDCDNQEATEHNHPPNDTVR
ncbi:hypothetical protein VitviT2T_028611 [Vitis vinifera]|uniref:ADP-ribosyl cyclase/cyclic ADP-ribose hydrolase n=1 Tax=Vitis vinifera TaxID=29760 RepID=A0ABY9DUJ6_VITVI|nr:hypothetical protein VitviT2T_028611 [Vitis vinifera]